MILMVFGIGIELQFYCMITVLILLLFMATCQLYLLGDDNSDIIVTDGDIAINFMNVSSIESNDFGCDSIHNGDYDDV